MFKPDPARSKKASAFAMAELVFHSAIRDLRKSNSNAVLGLAISIFQSMVMVIVFLFMMSIMGGGNRGIRGDTLLYVMSGVFMFMTHTKTVSAVSKSDGPTAPMMKHSPMNTIIAVVAAALSTLYQQTLSVFVILFFYHTMVRPISIDQPVGVAMMFLMAWGYGIAVGLAFKALTPWAPELFGLGTTIYTRMNMIASGKMFVANATPTFILSWFWWNPLFHIIDQSRGFVFLNYDPHYSTIEYPVKVTIAILMIGLMAEHFTRRRASLSWGAK
jgi:ABC-type polysaccharide/polyol phosphate export permease